MKFKLFIFVLILVSAWVIPATAQDFRFPLFQPGTVKNGNILGQDGIWRPGMISSEVIEEKVVTPQTPKETPRAEKKSAPKKVAACNWGWNDPATGECVNPWEGALPPAQVYRINHSTDNFERDRRRRGGVIIRSEGEEGIVIKSE